MRPGRLPFRLPLGLPAPWPRCPRTDGITAATSLPGDHPERTRTRCGGRMLSVDPDREMVCCDGYFPHWLSKEEVEPQLRDAGLTWTGLVKRVSEIGPDGYGPEGARLEREEREREARRRRAERPGARPAVSGEVRKWSA